MAIFIENENSLKKEVNKIKRDAIFLGLGILFSSCFALVLIFINIYLTAAFFCLMLVFLYKLTTNTSNIEMLRSGVQGEKRTQKVFEKLPNAYYIYSDLKVVFDDRESQLDHVVVGPTGVFVIESKNTNGKILGDGLEKYWVQEKIGSKGGLYKNEFYSPLKQVGTHVYRLSSVLKKNGINVWIESCVFFSNPKTVVEVKNLKVPVFSLKNHGSKELIDYIIEGTRTRLTEEDIKKINRIIKKEC